MKSSRGAENDWHCSGEKGKRTLKKRKRPRQEEDRKRQEKNTQNAKQIDEEGEEENFVIHFLQFCDIFSVLVQLNTSYGFCIIIKYTKLQ